VTSTSDVAEYYEDFAQTFVRDYLAGNARVARQLGLLRAAIPRTTRSVLVVGCGSGESVAFIARKVAPRARVLGVDLSAHAIELARHLYPAPNAEYRQADIHIPRSERNALHQRLLAAMAPVGQLVRPCRLRERPHHWREAKVSVSI
jgi:trans-aconitate methyltransferase